MAKLASKNNTDVLSQKFELENLDASIKIARSLVIFSPQIGKQLMTSLKQFINGSLQKQQQQALRPSLHPTDSLGKKEKPQIKILVLWHALSSVLIRGVGAGNLRKFFLPINAST